MLCYSLFIYQQCARQENGSRYFSAWSRTFSWPFEECSFKNNKNIQSIQHPPIWQFEKDEENKWGSNCPGCAGTEMSWSKFIWRYYWDETCKIEISWMQQVREKFKSMWQSIFYIYFRIEEDSPLGAADTITRPFLRLESCLFSCFTACMPWCVMRKVYWNK